jgi:hypothetical protein
VFERFTDRARRVVVLAQEEARMLNHNYIGTEHLLLGLIHEGEGVAAKALEALDISLNAVRLQVEEIIGEGQSPPTGHIPFTPRAKKILELSLREALQLNHNYIGTEHILLGMVREAEGVAAQVLQKLGANLSNVRQEVIRLLAGYPGGTTPEGVVVEQGDIEAVMGASLERRRGPAWRVERLGPNVRLRRREGEPERSPVCPRCDADLRASVRYRVEDVPGGSEGAAPARRAAFLYCSECGRLLTANLLDPDDADSVDGAEGADATGEPEGTAEPGAAGDTGER